MKDSYKEKVQQFISILDEEYAKFVRRSGKRRESYNSFARWTGISTGSMNQYLTGSRLPDLTNAVIMSTKYGRTDILDVLGYPQVVDTITNPEIGYIAINWGQLLDHPEDRRQIIAHIGEITGNNFDEYKKRKDSGEP